MQAPPHANPTMSKRATETAAGLPTGTLRAPFSGGVHDPSLDRDSCGVAAVARLDNTPRHEVVSRGLIALDRLEHRGAAGADETTGDGAGILLDLSHDFFRLRAPEAGLRAAELPEPGKLAVAVCFFPHEPARSKVLEMRLEQLVGRGRPPADQLARGAGRAERRRQAGPRGRTARSCSC